MTDALTSLGMSTELRKVADRAKREPAARFNSLAHLIDEELLARAFARLRGNAAIGVDGITKEQYGHDLQDKLRDLLERLKTMRYRHQSIRRVHIPKEKKGQTRPIGISATEDKVVQNALREVLEAVYEQTFMDCLIGDNWICRRKFQLTPATYGQAEAQTIVENCGNTLILRCSASENGGTARFASKLIGEREVLREQKTEGRSGGSVFANDHRSVSTSIHHVTESAVLPSEIEQLPDLHGYLIFASAPVWSTVRLRAPS